MHTLPFDQDLTGMLDTAANLLTVIVAVLAIIVTFVLDARTKKREMEVAAAHVKPLLAIETEEYKNEKGVVLVNHGLGTAVISLISIAKEGVLQEEDEQINLDTLMYDTEEVIWDEVASFTPKQTQYLEAGKRLYLVRLTEGTLKSERIPARRAKQLLNQFMNELSGVKIHIQYEDVFGNPQKDYFREF